MISRVVEYGVWTLVLIVAFVLEVMPFFFLLTVFNLAVGVPKGPALVLIPVILLALVVCACIVATRISRRFRGRPAAHGREPGGLSGPRLALVGKPAGPAEYYRDLKRFG